VDLDRRRLATHGIHKTSAPSFASPRSIGAAQVHDRFDLVVSQLPHRAEPDALGPLELKSDRARLCLISPNQERSNGELPSLVALGIREIDGSISNRLAPSKPWYFRGFLTPVRELSGLPTCNADHKSALSLANRTHL
jgi:hypothetical protein